MLHNKNLQKKIAPGVPGATAGLQTDETLQVADSNTSNGHADDQDQQKRIRGNNINNLFDPVDCPSEECRNLGHDGRNSSSSLKNTPLSKK